MTRSARFAQCVLCRIGAAVAGGALSCVTAMIHGGRLEGGEVLVAAIARAGGGNVGDRLGLGVYCGVGSVVTGSALARHAGVVHCCRGEGNKVQMAGITLRPSGDVGTRRWQACPPGHVTGGTLAGSATGNRRMIEGGRCPGRGAGVTGIALGRSGDVGSTLRLSVLRQIGAAMAGGALARQTRVIHRRRYEGREILVTAIAGTRCGNVIDALRLGVGKIEIAVVAVGTGSRCGKVIHGRRIEGGVVGVTGIALLRGGNVVAWLGQPRRGGARYVARSATAGRRWGKKRMVLRRCGPGGCAAMASTGVALG